MIFIMMKQQRFCGFCNRNFLVIFGVFILTTQLGSLWYMWETGSNAESTGNIANLAELTKHPKSSAHSNNNNNNNNNNDNDNNRNNDNNRSSSSNRRYHGDFIEAVEAVSVNRTIIISVTDSTYIDMTMNFYVTSIQSHGISNFLAVSLSKEACEKLSDEKIECVHIENNSKSGSVSEWGSVGFASKSIMKLLLVKKVIEFGFTVLLSDGDLIFRQNPFQFFTCQDCDIHIQDDHTNGLNTGFIFVRPTTRSIYLYHKLVSFTKTPIYKEFPQATDQTIFNHVLARRTPPGGIKIKLLEPERFPNGFHHFVHNGGKHCPKCVVIHNNWIKGIKAKEYRFKETLFWSYDKNGYYSEMGGQYLSYEHTMAERDSIDDQKRALKNALAIGMILNRIVILPVFYINSQPCTLTCLFQIEAFDLVFNGRYRENSFLRNPAVADMVKSSRSELHVVLSDKQLDVIPYQKNVFSFEPKIPHGANSNEILKWFGEINQNILVMHGLSGSFSYFTDFKTQEEFDEIIVRGLVPGDTTKDLRKYQDRYRIHGSIQRLIKRGLVIR